MTARSKWIRAAALTLATCLLAALLPGCSTRQKSAQEHRTVVTVWSKDRHDSSYQMARVRAYNESNPDNIQVDYRIFSDNYLQSLDSAFQNGRAPDLMAYTDQVFYHFYAQDRFVDLTPYMDEEFHAMFDDVLLDGVNVLDGACLLCAHMRHHSPTFLQPDHF